MVLTIALIIQGAIFGAFCSFVAKNKNRNIATWYVLGFFFSFIALIALAAVPKIEPVENIKELQRKSLWMISSFMGLIALFIYLVFAWHNLSLPDSVYKYFPSPNYKLKVAVHDFEISMQQMQSKFEQLNETEK